MSRYFLLFSLAAAGLVLLFSRPAGLQASPEADSAAVTDVSAPFSQKFTADVPALSIDLSGSWMIAPLSDTEQGSWRKVTLPYDLTGSEDVVLRSQFRLPEAQLDKSWRLTGSGILADAVLRLNGRELAGFASLGAGNDFTLAIPAKALRSGLNTIELEIREHEPWPFAQPSIGIAPYRRRIVSGPFALRASRDNSPSIGEATIGATKAGFRVTTKVEGVAGSPLRYKLALLEAARSTLVWESDWVKAAPTGGQTIEFTIPASIRAADTSLLRAGLILANDSGILDRREFSTGFIRELRATMTTLHGVTLIDDYESIPRMLLDEAGAIHATSLRIILPVREEILTLCDERGIAVYAELPLTMTPGGVVDDVLSSRFLEYAAGAVRSLQNHPSIIAWGLGDLNDETEEIAALYRKADKRIRSIDPERPIYSTNRNAVAMGPSSLIALNITGLDLLSAKSLISKIPSQRPWILTCLLIGTEPNALQTQQLAELTNLAERSGCRAVFWNTLRNFRTLRPATLVKVDDPYLLPTGCFSASGGLTGFGVVIGKAFQEETRINLEVEPTGGLEVVSTGSDTPAIFLIAAFAFALFFFLLLNADRRFREYISRALVRPFNFFADIRDQRLIPNAQTTVLGMVEAGGVILLIGGLLYDFRAAFLGQLLLSILLPYDWLLMDIMKIVWSPILLVTLGTLIVFGLLLGVAFLIRFSAMFVRQRIFFGDTFNITVWASLPLIFLIPLGAIVTRLDRTEGTVAIITIFFGIVALWIFFRMMKGIGVLFDVYPTKIYLYGISGMILLLFALVLHLNFHYSFFSELGFFFRLKDAAQAGGVGL